MDWDGYNLASDAAASFDNKASSAEAFNTGAALYDQPAYASTGIGDTFALAGYADNLGAMSDRTTSLRLARHSIPLAGKLDDVRLYRYAVQCG